MKPAIRVIIEGRGERKSVEKEVFPKRGDMDLENISSK